MYLLHCSVHKAIKPHRIVVCAFFVPNSTDLCTYICLILNIQVFLLELVGLFLGLALSLHVNVFRVRIYIHKVHRLNLSCVFILTVLSFA